MLPIYKKVSVPIYRYPTASEMEEIKKVGLEKYRTLKQLKKALRDEYKCFISENFIWRKFYDLEVKDAKIELPVEPELEVLNVMMRGKYPLSKLNYQQVLNQLGIYKLNPYSSDSENPNPCIGFYSNSFEEVEQVVDALGAKNIICGASIVNGVWYLRLKRPINAVKLMSIGFVPSTTDFNYLTNVYNGITVTVFPAKGTVRIIKATTKDIADSISRYVYAKMLEIGAI